MDQILAILRPVPSMLLIFYYVVSCKPCPGSNVRLEFVNGLEIRNKYIHGIQQVNMNEDEHKQNYYILLRLFVLLAIKINDEFCLRDSNEEQQ